ncbi:MAG: methionyl-tRNA formyltransferase [Pseudomonadota bacterium]
MRLAFMGSPDFSVPTLDALVDAGHEIACVYSQPPRPAGRGKTLRKTAVHSHAEARGLTVRTPASLKSADAQAAFAALDLHAAVVIAYGLILPQPILDAPRHGCINLHASRLPRWRGAAPIQRAIMAGDEMTGVDAMVMEAGLDTGPIIARETARIFPFDTAGDLHDRLATLAAQLSPTALQGYIDGSLPPMAQPENGVTYAHKVTADDQPIDWSQPAEVVDGQIRGLSPFPGALCHWHGTGGVDPIKLKALGSRLAEPDNAQITSAQPGTCLDDALLVACGTGSVRITRLQRPGKAPMDATMFLNGTPVPAGTILT